MDVDGIGRVKRDEGLVVRLATVGILARTWGFLCMPLFCEII